MRPENLPEDEQLMLKEIAEKDGVQILQLSCYTDEGVMDARNIVRVLLY